MQLVSDFTNNNSGRGKYFRRTSSGNTIIDDENLLHLSQQYIPTSDDPETLRTNIKSNSAASNRKKNNNAYITRSNSNNIKEVQENYHRFYKQLKKVNGVYLLQTMGAIIKAMHVIDDDNRGKKRISLSEKIELLKLLEENEIIIDFLTQKDLKENDINNKEIDIDTDEVETEDEEKLKMKMIFYIPMNIRKNMLIYMK